jgi:hypothetical protein
MLHLILKQILLCKICHKPYSEIDKPYILTCGNSLCYNCVIKFTRVVLDKSDPSCYFDNSHHHILEDPPVNYAYLNIIQNFYIKNKNISENELKSIFHSNNNGDKKMIEQEYNDIYYTCTDGSCNLNEFDKTIIKKTLFDNKILMNGFFEIQTEKYSYKGDFKNGLMHGQGEYKCDNFIYNGNLVNDIACGRGILLYNRLSGGIIKYEGNFNGFRNGEGLIVYENEDQYIGKWKNYLREGHGKFICKNGDLYEGEFYFNLLHGEGEFYSKLEKRRIKGRWSNGKENGEMLIYKDGITRPMRMLFRNGELITILEL